MTSTLGQFSSEGIPTEDKEAAIVPAIAELMNCLRRFLFSVYSDWCNTRFFGSFLKKF